MTDAHDPAEVGERRVRLPRLLIGPSFAIAAGLAPEGRGTEVGFERGAAKSRPLSEG